MNPEQRKRYAKVARLDTERQRLATVWNELPPGDERGKIFDRVRNLTHEIDRLILVGYQFAVPRPARA